MDSGLAPKRGASRNDDDDRKSSRAPVSPALFCWPRLWFGGGLLPGFGLRRIRPDSAGIAFGGGVTRRRLLGPLRRQQRRHRRHRLVDIPLANAIAAAPLGQV